MIAGRYRTGQGRCRRQRLAALLVAVPLALGAVAAPGATADGLRWTTDLHRVIWGWGGDPATLGDGRRLRLAGVDVPGLAGDASVALVESTRTALAELVGDAADLRLGLGAVATDRYGNVVAQLRRADGLWLQGELLRRGLARVRTTPDQRALAAEMLALEEEARRAGRGIWGDPAFAVRRHDDAAGFIGSFQLVAGRVVRVADTRGYLYLNFGQDWRRDFTVRARRGDLAAFRRAGLDLEAVAGRRVRVRGWLLDAGGPLVELSHAEQIEVLDE